MEGQLAVRAACHTDGFGWTENNERGRLLSSMTAATQNSNQLKPDSCVPHCFYWWMTRERRVPGRRGCCFQPGGSLINPPNEEHQAGGEALSRAASPAGLGASSVTRHAGRWFALGEDLPNAEGRRGGRSRRKRDKIGLHVKATPFQEVWSCRCDGGGVRGWRHPACLTVSGWGGEVLCTGVVGCRGHLLSVCCASCCWSLFVPHLPSRRVGGVSSGLFLFSGEEAGGLLSGRMGHLGIPRSADKCIG